MDIVVKPDKGSAGNHHYENKREENEHENAQEHLWNRRGEAKGNAPPSLDLANANDATVSRAHPHAPFLLLPRALSAEATLHIHTCILYIWLGG